MKNELKILQLFGIVELSFLNASEQTDITKQYAQWRSCAQVAHSAALCAGSGGDTFRAAALAGVEAEAKRQMNAMVTA